MNADQAFDNLVLRNALTIPLVEMAGETGHEKRMAAEDRPRAVTVRIDAMESGRMSAKKPAAASSRSRIAVPRDADDVAAASPDYSTDTELLAAPWLDEIEDARLGGARVVGRNAGSAGEHDFEAMKDTLVIRQTAGAGDLPILKPPVSPMPALAAESRPDGDRGSDLPLARRVSRFSFLPLVGMEEFDSAARELASGLAARNYDRPSIAVTGSVRGEGRTEIAIRLALALAKREEHRILLADFDIRKPEVAPRLGLSCKFFALGDALRGDCRLGEALTFSEEDNLYVLASRPPERRGDETLDGRQAEKLMSELHRAFDFVIIDCGPANRTDAVIVCRLAGGTVLTGRCGFSRGDDMEASSRELLSAGVGVAGMALVGA